MRESAHHIARDFESNYLRLRQNEGRIYTDEEVAQLPLIAPSHRYYKEWQVRRRSSQRLINYLREKKQVLSILETGCGNGWLSHQLATVPGSKVIGTDVNLAEIQQAATVFQDFPNLHFIYDPIAADTFDEQQFDIIVFAASIQYFPSLPETIRNGLRLLKRGGEIHIIDSHFYSQADLGAARKRSQLYFQTAGFPEMAGYYFHHSLDALAPFRYTILYNPNNFFSRLTRNKTPFYWIRIQS